MSTLYPPCDLLDVGWAVLRVVLVVLVLKAGLLEVGFAVLKMGLLEMGLLEVGFKVLEADLLEVGLTVLEIGSIILEDDLTKFENMLGVVIVALPAEFTATTLMV